MHISQDFYTLTSFDFKELKTRDALFKFECFSKFMQYLPAECVTHHGERGSSSCSQLQEDKAVQEREKALHITIILNLLVGSVSCLLERVESVRYL